MIPPHWIDQKTSDRIGSDRIPSIHSCCSVESGGEEAGLLEGERALHLLVVLPHHLAAAALEARPPHELRHGRDVEVERPGGGAGAGAPHLGLGGGGGCQKLGGRGGGRGAADDPVVVLPLVPAQRLPGGELLVADGAPVDSVGCGGSAGSVG